MCMINDTNDTMSGQKSNKQDLARQKAAEGGFYDPEMYPGILPKGLFKQILSLVFNLGDIPLTAAFVLKSRLPPRNNDNAHVYTLIDEIIAHFSLYSISIVISVNLNQLSDVPYRLMGAVNISLVVLGIVITASRGFRELSRTTGSGGLVKFVQVWVWLIIAVYSFLSWAFVFKANRKYDNEVKKFLQQLSR